MISHMADTASYSGAMKTNYPTAAKTRTAAAIKAKGNSKKGKASAKARNLAAAKSFAGSQGYPG